MPGGVCSRCGAAVGKSEEPKEFLPARTGLLPGLLELILWMMMLIPSLLKSLYAALLKKGCPQCEAGAKSIP